MLFEAIMEVRGAFMEIFMHEVPMDFHGGWLRSLLVLLLLYSEASRGVKNMFTYALDIFHGSQK